LGIMRPEAKPHDDDCGRVIRNLLICIASALTGGACVLILLYFCPFPTPPGGHDVDGPILFVYVVIGVLVFITLGCLIALAMWTVILARKLFAAGYHGDH